MLLYWWYFMIYYDIFCKHEKYVKKKKKIISNLRSKTYYCNIESILIKSQIIHISHIDW